MDDYQSMGIPEYWICDYLGIGGTFFIGSPKQPVITVCTLENGRYRLNQFRGEESIVSPGFPNLTLKANEIITAGN